MKKYITEAIGTFFLVLTIALCVGSGTDFAPLAIGTALMVMVYMGGHISGAHYNPAVSLGLALSGNLAWGEMVIYWVSQILGALLAALTASFLIDFSFAPGPGDGVGFAQAFVNEFLFTFALVLVVHNVAVSKKTEGNSFYGLAIGFTVLMAAFAGGGISGGAYNPAVGIGPIISDLIVGDGGGVGNLLLYILGPLAGGAVAAFVFKMQESD